MKRESIREAVRVMSLVLLMAIGLLSILATGGGGDAGPQVQPKPGVLAFDNATYTATEGAGATATITVVRTGGSSGAASVQYATANGTATEPGDYTATSGTLNWADGDASAKTFSIPIINDSAPESQESFSVSLSNAVGAGLGTAINATVTINDDDIVPTPGVLQLENTSYNVTEGTDLTVTLNVTRTGGTTGAVSVDYATANGTATDPGDYTAKSGTLNWADGDSAAKTIVIDIANDSTPESAETFSVNLSNVVSASLGANTSATVNIADDDNPGTVQLGSVSYNVTEGVDSAVTITVTRSGGAAGIASVDYATADGMATAPEDYTAKSGTLNWADGDSAAKTFDVLITNDTTAEVIQSFTINLSNATGATLGTNTSATVTITDNDQLTGKVSAPGGVLAMKEPGLLERMFAAIFGRNLKAAISDLVSPVDGAIVNLYEVDASGGIVSGVLDTATTNASGDYILNLPPADVPAVKYIVRAVVGSATMDSRVTSLNVDIDPTTDATSDLVSTIATDLADLTVQEVKEIQADVAELIPFIDTAGSPTATQISDRLQAQALRMGGEFRVLISKVSGGTICGLLMSASGVPLEGIDVVVRDYANWQVIARAITRSPDAYSNYCVNVPVQGATDPDGGTFSGDYIVGAFNSLDLTADNLRSASGWLHNGGPASRLEADKITITSAAPTLNSMNIRLTSGASTFVNSGATLIGTVKASGSSINLEGVDVVLSDYDNGIPMASATVEADGSYRINVLPGTYRVEAVNTTRAAYASQFYDGASGANISNKAIPVTLAEGSETPINFVLEAGAQLTGTITDGTTSNPVMRTRVRIDVSGGTNYGSEYTDREGYYHIWLKPDTYHVYAYGQETDGVNLGTAGSTVAIDYSASVMKIQGVVQDGSSNPVKHAKLRLYDSGYNFMGFETGDSNGAFTSYTALTGNHYLEIRIDRAGTSVGSVIYNGKTQLEGASGGDAINIAAGVDQDLGTISLPAGGMLKGNVYTDATMTTPSTDYRVQVRSGGTGSANAFLNVRTRADGSYLIALPAMTYERVKMGTVTGEGLCNNVAIIADATTTVNYIVGEVNCF